MTPSKDLLDIATQASTLYNRMRDRTGSEKTDTQTETGQTRLHRWQQVTARENTEVFERRLAWEKWDVAYNTLPLEDASPLTNDTPPNWLITVQHILHQAENISFEDFEGNKREAFGFLDPAYPVPFEEVLAICVIAGRKAVQPRIAPNQHLLSPRAQSDLERALLLRLNDLFAQTLERKFTLFRVFNNNSQTPPSGNHIYRQFITHLFNGGLLDTFREYAVLARLAGQCIDFWVEDTALFVQRLDADQREIARVFHNDQPLGQVIEIDPALSDAHHQGQFVKALVFASGQHLVYKPRDLTMEHGFQQLLEWLNAKGAEPKLKTLTVLPQKGYGWVEFAEFGACANDEEAHDYFRRVGMLLCALHLLEGTDCHKENLIACGPHPVLVDLETLLYHEPLTMGQDDDLPQAGALADQQLSNSVLNTGLLPRWEQSDSGKSFDVSALGAIEDQETHLPSLTWMHVNTDRMRIAKGTATNRPQANTAVLNGHRLSPDAYIHDITSGFEHIYTVIQNQKTAMLETCLSQFANCQTRFIFRPTRVYAVLLDRLLHPKFMKTGIDRSLELEILARPLLSLAQKPPYWPLLTEELRALEEMDIPYFSAPVSGNTLPLSDGETRIFRSPSYALVRNKILHMSEDKLREQLALIRGSLYARVATESRNWKDKTADLPPLESLPPADSPTLIASAYHLASALGKEALKDTVGGAAWIGLSFMPESQRFQLNRLGHDLYNGNAGVGLFLAALTAVSQQQPVSSGEWEPAQWRALSLSAFQQIHQLLQKPNEANLAARAIGIGGCTGLGSVLQALVSSARFLNSDMLLEDAKKVSRLITPEVIASDKRLDVLSGCAGALLGLLNLYRVAPDPEILELAVQCGTHLVNSRTHSDEGPRVWRTLHNQHLTGFSHGAGGMALALLRLYEQVHDDVFLATAKEAIDFERALFSADVCNWPDRRTDPPTFMSSWCHGATGIGLARLGGFSVFNGKSVQEEIQMAVETSMAHDPNGVDHLCCGNMGRAELLLCASETLSRPQLKEWALKQATWTLHRAGEAREFVLFAGLPKSLQHPGFFQGVSGIGYQLLRLAHPNIVPSALLWEIPNS